MSQRIPDTLRNPVRRVLFLLAAAFLCAPAFALAQTTPARPAPKFLSGKPDQAEGARVLESFRNVGVQGNYWLKFELRVMPRRGAERVIDGQMFGAPGPRGPLTRIITRDPANKGGNAEMHFILHGGAEPVAWEWNYGQRGVTPSRVEADALLAPIEATDLTLFDLQMPFLRWTDFVYEGVANVRGRPAHAFLLYPPEPLNGPSNRNVPVPAAVRVFLDTQFGAMTQAEWVDAVGKPMKTVTVLDLKKVNEQWIVKSIDLRNHATRDKTRMIVTAAALGLELTRMPFEPEKIARPLPVVPPELVQRF